MSGLDGLSSSIDSGAERGDRRGDREEDRPFPGAPPDRPPAPPVREDVKSWDEIKADPAAYEAALKELHAASGPSDVPEPSSRDSAPKATDEPGRTGSTDAENVGEKERAGDLRADTSGDDDAEALRQEIATLKSDNAHHKAEIENLKSEISELKNEITEIKEALRERDRESSLESSDALGAEGQEPGEQEEPKPGDKGTLMHVQSEFHGEKFDMYTDGTRWRSAEALEKEQEKDPEAGRQVITDVPGMRDQGTAVIGERPDDESELPVSAEGMLEADEQDAKLERVKNKLVRNLSDAVSATDNQVEAVRNALESPRPTGNPEVVVRPESGPIVDAAPQADPNVDAITQLAVVGILMGYQASHWIGRRVDDLRRRHDGSSG